MKKFVTFFTGKTDKDERYHTKRVHTAQNQETGTRVAKLYTPQNGKVLYTGPVNEDYAKSSGR